MSSATDQTPGAVADQLVEILRGRHSEADAITAAGLSGRLQIADGATSPETRELIRDVMDSHDLPVVSCHNGYYVADSLAEIERELESIDSRIAGLQERKKRLVGAYNRRRHDE